MKRVVFESNSKIQESGSFNEQQSQKQYSQDDIQSYGSTSGQNAQVARNTQMMRQSMNTRGFDDEQTTSGAKNRHPTQKTVESSQQKLGEANNVIRVSNPYKEGTQDSMIIEEYGKVNFGNTSSSNVPNTPVAEYDDKRSPITTSNEISSSRTQLQVKKKKEIKKYDPLKKKPVKPKITIEEADEIFDNEDERYEVKKLIKNYLQPPKLKQSTDEYRIFGMLPEVYETIQSNKNGKKKRDQISQSAKEDTIQDKSNQQSQQTDQDALNSNGGSSRNETGNLVNQKDKQDGQMVKYKGSSSQSQQQDNSLCFKLISKKQKEFLEYIEEQQENEKVSMFVISQESRFYKYWQAFMTIMCLMSSYIYTNIAAFRVHGYEDKTVRETYITFETFFFFDMVLNFFFEQIPQGHTKPIRQLEKIAWLYLQNDFPLDFIALLPIQVIELNRNKNYLFFLLKCVRLRKSIRYLQIRTLMQNIKKFYAERLQHLIDTDDQKANSSLEDQTKIELIMMYRYSLNTLSLIIVIINSSYFLGLFWYILCEIQEDIAMNQNSTLHNEHLMDEEYFQNYFDLAGQTPTQITVIVTYFAFTSLSTVGFGDFHPRSDFERLCCSFVLLFGVAIFSIIMSNFSQILVAFKSFNSNFDDGDNLTKFFGTIQKFNKMEPIEIDLKERIESFFEYKWEHDKNQAFQEDKDLELLQQLPSEVQVQIYNKYLFERFLVSFAKVFTFPKLNSPNKHAFYTWTDVNYRSFMLDILQHLECRREERLVVLYNELDEMNEVLFFETGMYEIGYEINRFTKYILRYKNSLARANAIGAYGATFNKRSLFKFRCASECKGFFIRKSMWLKVIDDNEPISLELKRQVFIDFETNLKKEVMIQKHKDMERWAQRADYESIIVLNGNQLKEMRANRDPQTSFSAVNQSAEGIKSGINMGQSTCENNHDLQSKVQQTNNIQSQVGQQTQQQQQSTIGRHDVSKLQSTLLQEDHKHCDGNVHDCINTTQNKCQNFIENQKIIFNLYDQLYVKYIEVKKNIERLKVENSQLLQGQQSSLSQIDHSRDIYFTNKNNMRQIKTKSNSDQGNLYNGSRVNTSGNFGEPPVETQRKMQRMRNSNKKNQKRQVIDSNQWQLSKEQEIENFDEEMSDDGRSPPQVHGHWTPVRLGDKNQNGMQQQNQNSQFQEGFSSNRPLKEQASLNTNNNDRDYYFKQQKQLRKNKKPMTRTKNTFSSSKYDSE